MPATRLFTVASKSPQTGTWNDSSSSGSFGQQIKFAGYDGIVIRGKAEKPVYLWVNNDQVEIRSAEPFWGQDCHEADDAIKNELLVLRTAELVDWLGEFGFGSVEVWGGFERQPIEGSWVRVLTAIRATARATPDLTRRR